MPVLPINRSQQDTRGRRKSRAQQVSSEDVAIVSSQISRPTKLSAPKEAFESTLGIAAQEAEPAFTKLQVAEVKQKTREDAVARSAASNGYRESEDTEFRRIKDEGDLSDTEQLKEMGRLSEANKQEILQNFTGSPEALALLTIKLDDIQSASRGRAADESVRLGKGKTDIALNAELSPIVSSVSQDPSVANINKGFLDVEDAVNDLAGAYDPLEEKLKIQEGKERVSIAAIDGLLIGGALDQADELMNDPGVFNSMSPTMQRDTRRRIDKAISAKNEIANKAAVAGAVKKAELSATRDHINTILGGSGLGLLTENGQDPVSVSAPFGEGVEASTSVQNAARLFATSQKLLIGGETALAGGMLAQARFIMSNSPEVQRNKELQKPIGKDLAALFGVPIGTPLADVMALIPPSPGEQAEIKAAGTARGKGRIEAEEQIGFIDEASTMVTDLLEEVKLDPSLVGVGGSLRSTGQTALGVIGDLGASGLVDSVKDMAFENTDLGLDDITDLFDSPTLSVLSIMENSIGLILARLRTPSGRIPVDVIKRSIDDVGLTGLKSSKQVQNRLNFVLEQLNRRSGSIEKRFSLPGRNETDVPSFKVVNGKLVPVGDI